MAGKGREMLKQQFKELLFFFTTSFSVSLGTFKEWRKFMAPAFTSLHLRNTFTFSL